MKGLQDNSPSSAVSSYRLRFMIPVVISACILFTLATLKQFPRIKKVVILTKDGHCFGDESGRDFCLR